MATKSSSKNEFFTALAHSLLCIGKSHLVLKDKQLEALELLYFGKDVFLWLPTGYGKSLCFQLLPFLFDFKFNRTGPLSLRSVVIVISPLVSLMVDQVCYFNLSGTFLARKSLPNRQYLCWTSKQVLQRICKYC